MDLVVTMSLTAFPLLHICIYIIHIIEIWGPTIKATVVSTGADNMCLVAISVIFRGIQTYGFDCKSCVGIPEGLHIFSIFIEASNTE